MSKRIALYLRVSTTEHTVENQHRELEAGAKRDGWNVVAVFTDAGISGSKGREKRPGCDGLCRGIARREFDQVAAWSVDRLRRSLQELVAFLAELHAKGIDLYLTGYRYRHASRKGDVPDDGRLCGVRMRDDRRTCQVGPRTGTEPGKTARASPGERGCRRAHPGKA